MVCCHLLLLTPSTNRPSFFYLDKLGPLENLQMPGNITVALPDGVGGFADPKPRLYFAEKPQDPPKRGDESLK